MMQPVRPDAAGPESQSADGGGLPPVHLARVYQRLLEVYGEPVWRPSGEPLGELIGTILSQHTSDVNSERAYGQLRAAFPAWEELLATPTERLAAVIRCGGLANLKARRIQEVLAELARRREAQAECAPATAGGESLEAFLCAELRRRQPLEAWEYLQELPGVGPKTAACVLLFALGWPVMPVDTHVHRVARRLGLLGPKVSAEQAHVLLAQMTPPAWVYALHVNLIRHGRRVCLAQRPRCPACPLLSECRYAGGLLAEEGAAALSAGQAAAAPSSIEEH
ncbi:endonuclease III domain-containing protein [Thermogemmatispora carboxidivorans]|uniref:endonuclease III domain-containing protein n=1 Tax=Thermogemmatispora carboxidivorans TaxID=1382306 RepID=UPI00069CAA42|nr:endonuclease III [Thermogemmatispora carboxidivorans]